MSFVIAIDREHQLTRVRFEGTTTGRDIIAATDALVAHPDYDASFDQMWTLATVSQLVVDPEEMEALVMSDRAHVESGTMGRVRVGIVVVGELRRLFIHLYEYQMRSSGQEIRLFSTEAEAMAWLRGERAERRAG